MFQGETAITIDEKGRMAVPTAYRELVARECGNRLVITYNPFDGGALYIYPYAAWEKLRERVNARASSGRTAHRVTQFKLVGAAAPVEPDGNGRITIPSSMRSAVKIDRKAILLGMGDRFELLSEAAHSALVNHVLTDDDIAADLEGLEL